MVMVVCVGGGRSKKKKKKIWRAVWSGVFFNIEIMTKTADALRYLSLFRNTLESQS